MGCSIVVRQIIEVSIKNGFRTQEDWDRHLAMKSAIEKGGIGEWALQSVKDKIGGNDTENNQTETTESGIGMAPQTQRTAGKKRYRSGRSQITSSAETRRQSYNVSAVSFP